MPSRARFPTLHVLLVAAAWAGTACTPVYTVPHVVAPRDPVQEFSLELPPNLEVRHVDFSATEFATDHNGMYAGAVGGRAFLKVYAVDRESGEAVLLIYEDIAHRKQPVQVIRFRSPGG